MEKSPLRYVWHYVKIFKLYLIVIMVFTIISMLCGQFYPYYLAKIYNTVAVSSEDPQIWGEIINFALIALGLGLGKVLFMEINMFINGRYIPSVHTMVIRDTFDYVNKHSIAYFHKEMSGNIATKVEQINNGVSEFFNNILNSSYSIIFLIVSIGILSFLNLWFLLTMVIWLIFIVLSGIYLGGKRSAYAKMTSSRQSKASAMIVDSLANYSEIKSFANFRFERLNLLKYLRLYRQAETIENRIKAWIHLSQNLITVISMLAFMFLSIWVLKNKGIDSTQFIFANTIFAMMAGMIFEISWVYSNMARIFGQMSSALETLAVEPELKDASGACKLEIKHAEILFEQVNFGYENKRQIFENLNIEIKPGEKVGLVGTSGAGKSTFVKLLARYFDVNSGAIKINGIDIRKITQDSLHRNIATIPQDVCLFNRTLFENIRYGKTNAREEDVVRAAKKASADEFIKAFPDGYQTRVGERGVVLSGGERQRIAIARAILKNAPILIFDEATSALDSRSEKHIQKSLAQLMRNKTVIAIAHRLSTLREMDRILVFEKGQIIEQGTHLALLRKKGQYAKLYKMQADGFMGYDGSSAEPSVTL